MGILEAPGLIVLGAGADQRFLIRTAQEMGFRVIAFEVYDTVRIDTGASQIQRASEAFKAVRARSGTGEG
jgi:uroporphyrinogen-III synthase